MNVRPYSDSIDLKQGANVNGSQDVLLLEPITMDSEDKDLEDLVVYQGMEVITERLKLFSRTQEIWKP
jgi:hypothetical protein